MHRRIRRVAAAFAVAALLFTQLALSAFACPGEAMMSMQSGEAMHGPDCDGMDSGPSPLCQSHCAQGQQSLDKPDAPSVPPAIMIGLLAWPVVLGDSCTLSHPGPHDARVAPPPEPPHCLRDCCLRL